MARQTIKNAINHTIGYIEDVGHGKQKALDASFHTLGYYDPATNTTKDATHRTMGRGNQLMALIDRTR